MHSRPYFVDWALEHCIVLYCIVKNNFVVPTIQVCSTRRQHNMQKQNAHSSLFAFAINATWLIHLSRPAPLFKISGFAITETPLSFRLCLAERCWSAKPPTHASRNLQNMISTKDLSEVKANQTTHYWHSVTSSEMTDISILSFPLNAYLYITLTIFVEVIILWRWKTIFIRHTKHITERKTAARVSPLSAGLE